MVGMMEGALFLSALVSPGAEGPVPQVWCDDILTWVLATLIFLANLAGGIVVGVAVIHGLWRYVRNLLHTEGGDVPKEAIRLSLGRSLALALEFQVAADILGTALHPTVNDVILLGAIVLLRTILNFFLNRELREVEQRAQEARTGPPAAAQVVRETQK